MSSKEKKYEDIYSAWNKSTFLHFENALYHMGKILLFAGKVEGKRGSRSMTDKATFYANPWDLIPHFTDLLTRHKVAVPETLFRGSTYGNEIVSRTLRIDFAENLNSPVIFEVGEGPGKKGRTGQIEPAGEATKVKVMLGIDDARRLAAKLTMYIDRWVAEGMPMHDQPNNMDDVYQAADTFQGDEEEANSDFEPVHEDDDPITKAHKWLAGMLLSGKPADDKTRNKFFAIMGEYCRIAGTDPDETRAGIIARVTKGKTRSWRDLDEVEGKAVASAMRLLLEEAKK